jgi:endoglucanase
VDSDGKFRVSAVIWNIFMYRFVHTVFFLLLGVSNAVAAPIELHRGVALHEWLNWAPIDEAGQYRQPPYETMQGWLARNRPIGDWPEGNELERIRGFGFDFVRVTVDPGPLLASSGKDRELALGVLRDAVRQLIDADLKVVFNFHPNNQVETYSPVGIEKRPGSPEILAYSEIVIETTKMLGGFDKGMVAIEPFNEPAYYPCDTTGTEDWQNVLADQIKAIRAVDEDITIIATGACGGGVEGLVDVDATTLDDPNILYSFHMYRPHAFTHQRLEDGWASGLPWPASAKSRDEVLATLDAAMIAAGVNPVERQINRFRISGDLDAYYAEDQGEAQMEGLFQQALDWAVANGVEKNRLFMGEFGVILRDAEGREGAFDDDRLRYLETARTLAESHGIAWSLWEYSNPHGMSFIVPEGPAVADPSLIEAMGLDQIDLDQSSASR